MLGAILAGSSSLSGELIVKVAPSVQRKACERKIKLSVGPGIEVEEIELRDAAGSFRRVLLASGRARSAANLRHRGMTGIIGDCRTFLFRERRSCSTCDWDAGDA
jgi:hypothetical protein